MFIVTSIPKNVTSRPEECYYSGSRWKKELLGFRFRRGFTCIFLMAGIHEFSEFVTE